jgi:hypothetical protein
MKFEELHWLPEGVRKEEFKFGSEPLVIFKRYPQAWKTTVKGYPLGT